MIKMQGKFTILLLVAALYVASAKDIDVTVEHSCPMNEEWHLCGRLCEPNCAAPAPKLCPRIACTQFTEGCRCKAGYVRDVDGRRNCIKEKDCR